MRLPRRAPREVYRVYGEEEFFAAAHEPPPWSAPESASDARAHLHRIAGATMLLAVIGAIGGLIAAASLTSVGGSRRRSGARRVAGLTGSLRSTRPLVDARSEHSSLSRAPRRVSRRPPRWDSAELLRHSRASVSRVTPPRALRERISTGEVAAPAQSAREVPEPSGSVAAPSAQAQFGFER